MATVIFGCVVQDVDSEVVKVSLPEGDRVIPREAYNDAVRRANRAEEFHTYVRSAIDASIADWKANRGPDSELGRNMEQGTPVTDHSSDPS